MNAIAEVNTEGHYTGREYTITKVYGTGGALEANADGTLGRRYHLVKTYL